MDEDRFNMEVRKFLKAVGVTSQREIETHVRSALGSGRITPDAKLAAKMVLTVPEIGLTHEIHGTIELS